MIEKMIESMRKAGIKKEDLFYAMRKTDRVVTEMNKHLLTKKELKEWADAVDEYNRNNLDTRD